MLLNPAFRYKLIARLRAIAKKVIQDTNLIFEADALADNLAARSTLIANT